METTLGILIGTMNRLPSLKRVLDSLIDKVNVSHEIIVIDAGSTDGTQEFLRHFQGVTFVSDGERIGQAKSLNQVIRNLNSRYFCWISDDNVVAEGVLDEAVSMLDGNARIGMVSLKVKDMIGHLSELPYIGGVWSGILNCNQGMLPTRLMRELGGFDECIRDYGIDIDLTTRVLLAGYQVVFTRKIAIYHYRDYETKTWIDSDARKRRLQNSRELYNRKYANITRRRLNRFKGKKSPIIPIIESLYRIANRRGVSLEKLFGVNERDWRNVISGVYISMWDFLLNWRKPYYLVQKIPVRDIQEILGDVKKSKGSE